MKRIFTQALVIVSLALLSASVKAEKLPVGIWKLVKINNKTVDEKKPILKIIDKKGRFRVLWSVTDGETFWTKQMGTWETVAPGMVVENCEYSPSGNVIIKYEVKKDSLYETFSYPSSPNVIYNQVFIKVK